MTCTAGLVQIRPAAQRAVARHRKCSTNLALVFRVGHGGETSPGQAEVVRGYEGIDVREVLLSTARRLTYMHAQATAMAIAV